MDRIKRIKNKFRKRAISTVIKTFVYENFMHFELILLNNLEKS